jgi:hypothetical protein
MSFYSLESTRRCPKLLLSFIPAGTYEASGRNCYKTPAEKHAGLARLEIYVDFTSHAQDSDLVTRAPTRLLTPHVAL